MKTAGDKDNLKYYVFYKPYNVLNQFSKERPEHITLADFLKVPSDVYPVGRLDKDSEGLIILTNDKSLNAALLTPSKGHVRTYLVQVDGDIQHDAVQKLGRGIDISLDSGMYHTKPCDVKKLNKEPVLPDRNPPVRYRKNIPTSWIKIELIEGKNRQVRKMCAAVGFPVLRLVRVQIGQVKIGKLQPGKYQEMKREVLFEQLALDIDTSGFTKPKIQPAEKKKGVFANKDKRTGAIKSSFSGTFRKASTRPKKK